MRMFYNSLCRTTDTAMHAEQGSESDMRSHPTQMPGVVKSAEEIEWPYSDPTAPEKQPS